MKTINVDVEKAKDDIYWAASTNAPGVVSAYGVSLSELKKNFEQAYSDYRETAKEMYEDLGNDFANPNLVYELDLQEFFKLVPEISMTGIAQKANINKSLLRQYVTGKANASEKRLKEIEDAVYELGQELLSISF